MASLTDSSPAQLQELQRRLQSYLDHDPDNPRLLADLADTQMQLANWDEARSTLQRALCLTPDDPLARYLLAVVDLSQGRRDDAAAGLAHLMTQGHAHPGVRWNLARCQALANNWPAVAITLQVPVLEDLPVELLDSWALLRVRALHQCGDVSQALPLARQWQALCDGRGMPVAGRAALITLLLDAEQSADAATQLAQCSTAELESHSELATSAGYVALGDADGKQALAWFQRGLTLEHTNARAYLGEGLAAAALGLADQAIRSIKAAVEYGPSHLGSWHALAWMQLLAQDLDGAEHSFKSALARDDSFGESHGGIALMQVLRGQPEAARHHLRTALKLNPGGFNGWVAQWMLAHQEQTLTPTVLRQLRQLLEARASLHQPLLAALLKRWHPPQSRD